MAGRPRIYDRTQQVTTSIQGIFWDLAREKHISWKEALEAGIKLLAEGGEPPPLAKETIQKHINIEKQMTTMLTNKDEELEKTKKELCGLKNGKKNF